MRSWIIALPRQDLNRCIELGSFGKESNQGKISEVQEGDGIACYAVKEGLITALGHVTRGYYYDETPQFLKSGVFGHRFDFSATQLGSAEFAVNSLPPLSSVPVGGNFGLLVKAGFREITADDWKLFCDRAGLDELAKSTETSHDGRHWWWVNQGQSYNAERKGSYIWAPQRGKNGQEIFHHKNVSLVKSGDVILHYSEGNVVAVSIARGDGKAAARPTELSSEAWASDGWMVDVNYFDLDPPIARNQISEKLREGIGAESRSPFARTGSVNQGYLFPLSNGAVAALVHELPQLLPPGVEPPEAVDTPDVDLDSAEMEIVTMDNFDYKIAMRQLIAAINNSGFTFEPWQVACYVTAMRTKPFLILAGVSGSGKSQLPALVARATGSVSEVMPVRPDWTDSSDVLGYVELQGKFKPGQLLEIARRATQSKVQQFICIIDEMNLARVEHYFAEILSRIEEVRRFSGNGSSLLTQNLAGTDAHWKTISLPPNLALIGTVNMDESSHDFSRKVLDRAFTLEFSEIDLENWEGTNNKTNSEKSVWPVAAWQGRARRLSELIGLSDAELEQIRQTVKVLVEINTFLSKAQLQIAYRSRDEICLFVLHANDVLDSFTTRNGAVVKPLDLAIQMKILPRIAGGGNSVRRLVLELLGWTVNREPIKDADDAVGIMTAWEKADKPQFLEQALFPRSCARLCLMWERIQTESFTSYWL